MHKYSEMKKVFSFQQFVEEAPETKKLIVKNPLKIKMYGLIWLVH